MVQTRTFLKTTAFLVVWSLICAILIDRFFYGTNLEAVLCGIGLAVLFYLLRATHRISYGFAEVVVGTLLLWQAIYWGVGRGDFGGDFGGDFTRFDARTIALQSYAGVFILVRGLDNIVEGYSKRDLFLRALRRWFT